MMFEPDPDLVADAVDYLTDAAFIAGTLNSNSVFDHHAATDYLRAAAALYSERVTGEASYG